MYDVAIIGAGWAGFNAALKAKENSLRVALIEKNQIGGTCLNRGCIPTKALIQSAKVFTLFTKASSFGIDITESPRLNFTKLQESKNKTISQLQSGMQFMLKGIDLINSSVKFISPEALVTTEGQEIKAKSFIIATGSRPFELPNLKFDGKKIVSSDDILNLKEIPKTILIIGGGVIGCEFASLFSALGTHVTIAEKLPQILTGIDKEIVKKIETFFKKKGIKINVGIDATTLDFSQFELILVCIGRVPDLDSLNLNAAGVITEKNRIVTDANLRTNVKNIYATGDCAAKIMLAHYAAYQGQIAVYNIMNPDSPKNADNRNVPACIFTEPEIASVGITEDEGLSKNIAIDIHRFDFRGSGMARIIGEAEGLIKIISDKNNDEIIGASIIGPKATELIAVLTVAASARLKVSQIKNTIFAHPTLSEGIGEGLR